MLLAGSAAADEFNMTPGVTETSHQIYDLHMLIFWVCVVIGAGVFGVILWSIIAHRKAAGHEAAQFHENTRLEIAWTLVPVAILIAMAWPATKVLVNMYNTSNPDMTVEVRGYQWRWQYSYLDDHLKKQFGFFSNLATPADEIDNKAAKGEFYLREVDKPLRIPANRKVRFLITSEDVIHSWWVPDFGLKRDAIPGIVNDVWTEVKEPGVYRGQCAELCGQNHGFMPIVVQVMPQDKYDAWYADQVKAEKEREAAVSKTFTPDQLKAQGEKVYNSICAACHQPNGKGVPPVFPALAGSPIATGPLEKHIDTVVNGVPGTAMQAFGKQLDPVQIASVIYYERHSFGNNTTNKPVQPADVVAREQASQK